ncbi:DegT/DnrJ/EryC1/StrS family aminotransferase [Flavobacterium chilense]|uniref:dTDP-4-amino-4,6-dideoxygalactose transaminase n=1 Tax=Flavobacterium chilense TaxID=946677 RepID=A0A1M7GRT5_9FLAO|nr:aminotransferase class I/II-fold pyridoxal phosphate-dependent enzyme [Flavobacterium chilense]SHM18980.1 dTDP-4-amino-4,6-dideoxygalactose transaminase [Flavobacterium chilense]
MNKKKIWLSAPHISGYEKKYIDEAFETNWISSVGPNLTFFEQKLEQYLGESKHVAVLNTGTAAIHLGLILLGVMAGDEVLCQTMTFSASANPIIYQGGIPVFIDSEPETWNICPRALELAIKDRISKGKKPKAIIAVHIYGIPYKINEVRAIADQYQIPILEDSAEALGSSYKGQKCGTFGDISIISFNGSKIITTSGGGAIVTKSKVLKDKAIFLATQSKESVHYYQHNEIGYNYRMSNVSAAIGRGQLQVLDDYVHLRRKMHDFYNDLFQEINGVYVFKVLNNDYFSNYWLTTILVNPNETGGITNKQIKLELDKEDIECRLLWKPLHMQPIFKEYPYYGTNISEKLFENGLCLPSSSNLNDFDKERIKQAIFNLFG